VPSQLKYAADPYETLIQRESYTLYARDTFSFFQNWAANAVLRNTSGIWDASIASLVVPMKSEKIKFDEFWEAQGNLYPLLILLMYIIPIHRLVMRIVTERESNSRDVMKVMGMREVSYWISWFIYFMTITSLIAMGATFIAKTNVIPNSNWFLIYVYFWLYSLSIFGYVVFMSSLFSSSIVASLVSNLLYFFTHMCDYAVKNDYLPEYHKILASFLPSIAMKRAFVNILKYERAGRGLQYYNLGELYYNYRVEDAFYMFFTTFVLFFGLGLYLTNVMRLSKQDSDSELKLPWYYPCTWKYWTGRRAGFGSKEEKVHPFIFLDNTNNKTTKGGE